MENGVFSEYFLAANSAEGFINEFASNYAPDWRAYIIKGGPGTGKSSFMRLFAARAANKGYRAELCPCSSDPASLDAVILPEQKTIILDGTAPHVVEPEMVGVCEQIVNVGQFWSGELLRQNRAEITRLSAECAAEHKKAANYIAAAGKLIKFNLSHSLCALNIEKAAARAAALAKKYIRVRGPQAKEWVRFIEGITPSGFITLAESSLNKDARIITIADPHATAATAILSFLRDYALNKHHEVITLKSPLLPSEMLSGLVLPDLGLAFMRSDRCSATAARRVRADRLYDDAVLHSAKQKMRFNKKVADSLISKACESLAAAKAVHDKLEKQYISAMDFPALNEFIASFLQKEIN